MMFIICLQGYNLRAHLQRIMQFSDEMESSSDDDYSVESFDDEGAEAELQRIVGKDQGEGHDRNITPKPTNQTSNALVAVEGEILCKVAPFLYTQQTVVLNARKPAYSTKYKIITNELGVWGIQLVMSA